ncbi:MAG: porin [Burkholderiales bacterium]|nr:porin [Bacteroidia bacterium]
MKKHIIYCLLAFKSIYATAQDSLKVNPLTFSGYIETYYSYDLGNPDNHTRPSFFYSFNRHNEANLNLGYVKANYNTDKVRGNFALMAGTYAQYNMTNEQGLLKNIFEANAGFKLMKNKNIWLDAGIFPSHLGFESAVGKDCWNLTRSILAENSPYYEAGAKLNYTSKNEKLYLAALYLNGWQRIQKNPGNQTPAFGTQLTYKPNSRILLNWSSYGGSELPDSVGQLRLFNNFYSQLQITDKFGITAGFDIGLQQIKHDTSAYNNWYSPVLIVQFKPTKKIRIAARGEYYSDEKGVIIATGTPNGFQTFGYSLNFDYVVSNNVLWRIEGRGLSSIDKIFIMDNKPSTENYFITSSLCMHF